MDLQVFVLWLLGVIIPVVVLYYVVKSATKSTEIHKEQLRQSLYLEAMARKQGITDQEIEAINNAVDKVTK